MGLTQSKPENPYVRDRVRLCDGLAPLDWCTVTTAGDGRFVFRLGDFKRTRQPDETNMLSITLDYIDLMLLTRVRMVIGDFCNFGNLVGCYALDENTIVLVDMNINDNTLRQRLVAVDPHRATAHAFLDRGYKIDVLPGERLSYITGVSVVSEDRVMTNLTKMSFGPFTIAQVVIVYPKHPLNREILPGSVFALVEAYRRLRRELDTAEYEFRVSSADAPFFLSPTKIGFFVDRHDLRANQRWRVRGMGVAGGTECVLEDVMCLDPSYIVVCDLLTNSTSIERINPDPVTNFPYNHEHRLPHQSLTASACVKEVGLLVTDRFPANGWHSMAVRILDTVAQWMYRLACLCEAAQLGFEARMPSFGYCNFWNRMSMYFFDRWNDFLNVRSWVLGMKKIRFGLLNTKTMEWREQPGVADQMRLNEYKNIGLSAFRDGHFLIYDRENETRTAARFIGNSRQEPKAEELRVLSNPLRCFSLKTLAELQIRKRPIARLAIMQIAARIQY